MRATAYGAAAVFAALLCVETTSAQWQPAPWIPRAPDATGPGYYRADCLGQWFGPNYNLYPPFPPFNGMIFARQAAYRPGCCGPGGAAFGMPGIGGVPSFPTHPYARGPRDFFMLEE